MNYFNGAFVSMTARQGPMSMAAEVLGSDAAQELYDRGGGDNDATLEAQFGEPDDAGTSVVLIETSEREGED
jgi:hypothetical protein